MDLQKEWNTMSDEMAIKTDIDLNIQRASLTTYESILRNLEAKLIWIRVFSIPALAGTLFTEGTLKYILLAFFIVYEIGAMSLRSRLRKLPRNIDYTSVTKQLLTEQIAMINKIIKLESNAVYFFGPFIGPAGLLGGLLLSLKTFEQVKLHHPNILVYLLAAGLLVFPMKWLGDKMNKYAFAKDLEKLSANLEELS